MNVASESSFTDDGAVWSSRLGTSVGRGGGEKHDN